MNYKPVTAEEKYLETRGTLEFVLRSLRKAYNEGLFYSPSLKKYIHFLLKEGDKSIKKVSE